MDLKTRTAGLSTLMNLVLTGVKFGLYSITGSMAILAEACHSMTDIATSLLVFVAVRRGGKGKRLELLISLAIALLLTGVAVFLIRRAIVDESPVITNAVPSGLLFILFSFGSYFIYRFETRIGRQEASIGLISDGLHAKADMAASLLTGFSLLFYALGVNLDRWVALLIAFFILSFALETFANVVRVHRRGNMEHLFEHRSSGTLASLFDKNAVIAAVRWFRSFLEGRLVNPRVARAILRMVVLLPLLCLAVFYLSTCLFIVGVREQAMVERFGKPLSENPVGPGLHVKLPWPLERVVKTDTMGIREMNIGNVTDEKSLALLWTRQHGEEKPFLSGDNNYFYPYVVIHYRIGNLFDHLYKNSDPLQIMDGEAFRIFTVLFAQTSFYDIATVDRGIFESTVRDTLQQVLDRSQCGIELLSVNLKDIHPPIAIAYAFEQVIAGLQQKQQIINQARGYRNQMLPQARGNAFAATEGAKGAKARKTGKAQGSAERFRLSLPSTAAERDLTISRIYLRDMGASLKETTTVLVDPKAGRPELWMDFETLFSTSSTQKQGPYAQ